MDLTATDAGFSYTTVLWQLDQTGAPMAGKIVVDSVHGGPAAVAWNGTVFGVVWADTYNGTGTYFRAYAPSGAPTTSIVRINALDIQSGVDIVASGSDFLLTFADYNAGTSQVFQVAKVDATGQPVGTPGTFTPPLARVVSPQIAPSAAGFRLWWCDNRSGKYAVHSQPTDANGASTGVDVAATDGTADAEFWSATQTPTGYAVAYVGFTSTPSNYLLPTDASGAPSGTPVAIGSATANQLAAVLWNGSRLAVLTGDTFEFRDAAMAPIGQPFAFASFTGGGIRYSSLHWTPSRYFAISGTDTATGVPVARVFGDLGCDAPQ